MASVCTSVFTPTSQPMTQEDLAESCCPDCDQAHRELRGCAETSIPIALYNGRTGVMQILCGDCEGIMVEFVVARIPEPVTDAAQFGLN